MRRAAILAAGATMLGATPAQATFPGDNGRIVFQRPVGKQVELFTVKANGKGLRRLTRTRAWEEHAQWSADGRRLVFARSAPSGNPSEIWTMRADGRNRRALTSFGSTSLAPTWSPDGSIAFFTLKDFPADDAMPPAELYSMRSDGSAQARLTDDDQIQTDPEWSPDGRAIAYSQWKAVPGEEGVFDIGLSLMDPDGSDQRPLLGISAKRDIVSMSWSPDGRWIAYEVASAHPSGRVKGDRQSDLAIIRADGRHRRRLTRTAAHETHPVWSPDGRRLAFTSDRHRREFELYTMRRDGTHVRRLTRNRAPEEHPNWQARVAP